MLQHIIASGLTVEQPVAQFNRAELAQALSDLIADPDMNDAFAEAVRDNPDGTVKFIAFVQPKG